MVDPQQAAVTGGLSLSLDVTQIYQMLGQLMAENAALKLQNAQYAQVVAQICPPPEIAQDAPAVEADAEVAAAADNVTPLTKGRATKPPEASDG